MASDSVSTNTLGAQVVFDGNSPRTFTATARAVISGGDLVQISGTTNDVGSGVSSYANGDLTVFGAQDVTLCNGIALNTAASGALVTVATRGAYLMRAGGVVSGGALVQHNASGNVANLGVLGSVSVGTVGPRPIGTAMTTTGSGTNLYSLVYLNV